MRFREWAYAYTGKEYPDSLSGFKEMIDKRLKVLFSNFIDYDELEMGEFKYSNRELHREEIELFELILDIFPSNRSGERNVLANIKEWNWENVTLENKKALYISLKGVSKLKNWEHLKVNWDDLFLMVRYPGEYRMKKAINDIVEVLDYIDTEDEGYVKARDVAEKRIKELYRKATTLGGGSRNMFYEIEKQMREKCNK